MPYSRPLCSDLFDEAMMTRYSSMHLTTLSCNRLLLASLTQDFLNRTNSLLGSLSDCLPYIRHASIGLKMLHISFIPSYFKE